ncbi:hypothetical protein DM82_5680 [Burkholderia oklahomensis]|uniref:Uncharacterized protein n=1 Tax=Burkholderia oklahomensis TaxID=342113 RepID=A0AAI8BCT6_9BURK|nr:hypothetical protein DM82_5680 [Burkholderia oklahomensis]
MTFAPRTIPRQIDYASSRAATIAVGVAAFPQLSNAAGPGPDRSSAHVMTVAAHKSVDARIDSLHRRLRSCDRHERYGQPAFLRRNRRRARRRRRKTDHGVSGAVRQRVRYAKAEHGCNFPWQWPPHHQERTVLDIPSEPAVHGDRERTDSGSYTGQSDGCFCQTCAPRHNGPEIGHANRRPDRHDRLPRRRAAVACGKNEPPWGAGRSRAHDASGRSPLRPSPERSRRRLLRRSRLCQWRASGDLRADTGAGHRPIHTATATLKRDSVPATRSPCSTSTCRSSPLRF